MKKFVCLLAIGTILLAATTMASMDTNLKALKTENDADAALGNMRLAAVRRRHNNRRPCLKFEQDCSRRPQGCCRSKNKVQDLTCGLSRAEWTRGKLAWMCYHVFRWG